MMQPFYNPQNINFQPIPIPQSLGYAQPNNLGEPPKNIVENEINNIPLDLNLPAKMNEVE